jgi:hypothetical protein
MKRLGLFVLLAVLWTGCTEPVLPPNDSNEVIVKSIPSLDVVEAELTGDPFKLWLKGYHQNALYLARGDMRRRPPTMIQFPDNTLEDVPGETRFLVQSILEQGALYPDMGVRDEGLRVTNVPGATVASLMVRCAYTPENFKIALARLRHIVKERGRVVAGPPRLLLYQSEDWIPAAFRVMEVQVPITALED